MYGIVGSRRSHRRFRRSLQLSALEEFLSDAEIEAICVEHGHAWRRRLLGPGDMVRSMVYRRLSRDRSIARVLADLAAIRSGEGGGSAPTDSAWCQARDRLPQAVWEDLIARSADRLLSRVGGDHIWRDREVLIFDGSTVSMPDDPRLVESFGYANTRHGFSRFPLGRISFLVRFGVEAVLDYRLGPYRTDENEQFRDMWTSLPKGCICLCDRHLSNFYNLSKLLARSVYVATRLHGRRDPWRLIEKGRELGPNEWLVPLELDPQLRNKYNDPGLPERLWVRLIRVSRQRGKKRREVWVVTTLVDPARYPRREVAELYRRRWSVETRIGSLKTTLAMSVLRSKCPDAVRKEIAATIVAHNLVWTLVHQAAKVTGTPAEKISFAGAVKCALAYSHELRATNRRTRPVVYRAMLLEIARHTNHHPKGRIEPRMIKRDPVRYPHLRVSRKQARQMCLT